MLFDVSSKCRLLSYLSLHLYILKTSLLLSFFHLSSPIYSSCYINDWAIYKSNVQIRHTVLTMCNPVVCFNACKWSAKAQMSCNHHCKALHVTSCKYCTMLLRLALALAPVSSARHSDISVALQRGFYH